MSHSLPTFDSIFTSALVAYKKRTKHDLASHPLFSRLQTCTSPDAILIVLREQIPAFDQSHSDSDTLTKWLIPTVNVLYAFSATINTGVSMVNINMFPCRESRF